MEMCEVSVALGQQGSKARPIKFVGMVGKA